MAALALGLVGAALAPAGYAAIGWTIGTMAGNLLFAKTNRQVQEGPRLNDLRVQASTYGVGIPYVVGTMKLAGNLIWTGGIAEVVTESTESVGKGGGGTEVTTRTYNYVASFAIGLAEGPIAGVRRIWADGELIYDANATDVNAIAAAGAIGGQITVYTGSATQLPDPTMESYLGAGNVPAHRGMAYVVFTSYDITRWGRIPNLEFEVVGTGSTTAPIAVNSPPSGHARFFGNQVTFDGGLVYLARLAASAAPQTTDERFTLTPAGDVVAYTKNVNTTYSHSGAHGTYVPTGNILGLFIPAGQSPSFFSWLRVSGTAVIESDANIPNAFSGVFFHGCWRAGNTVLLGVHQPFFNQRTLNFYRWNEQLGLPDISPFKSLVYTAATDNEARRAAITVADGYFYVVRQFAGTSQRGLDKYDTEGNLVDSWNWNTGTADATAPAGVAIVDDQLFVSATSASNGYLIKIFPGGAFTIVSGAHAINTGNISNNDVTAPLPGVAWGINGSALLNPQVTPGTQQLGALVSALCVKAGLTAGDLDVSALTDTVAGYAVGRPMTARAAVETLQQAFFFDAVESDTKLKFVKRGGASVVTIPADDLGASEPGGDPEDLVTVERQDETEAPRQVTVQFFNGSGGYAQGSEYARRLVTRSSEQAFVDLPIVMTPDQARRAAEVLLYNAHLERMPVRWSTTVKYDKYEPTDVMTLDTGATTYTVRATRKRNEGQRILWEGVPDHAGAHSGAGSGATSQADPTALAVPGPALLELLDVPILRDADDDAGFYAALAGVLSGWRGGVLYSSPDGVDYTQAGAVVSGTAIGAATTALGNWTGGNFWDEGNTVTVRLGAGTLASSTRDAVLAGANTALLGGEIIQFRTATLVSGTTYTLSGLLRGRFGTEAGQSTHAIGDRFVLLQVAGMVRVDRPTSELNVARQYKGVSYGLTIGAAAAQSFTNTGVGKKPLAPVHLRGFRNAGNDAIFNWTRRTRVGAAWRDYVDASLGETAESYEVDVMQGATVKRTLTSSTPTVTYTSAQQVTDFGSNQAIGTISVRVYQISAAVGRGVAATATL
jgi:hypothetical protein